MSPRFRRFWLGAVCVAGLACQRGTEPPPDTPTEAPPKFDVPTAEGDERFAAETALKTDFEDLRGLWRYHDRWGYERRLSVLKDTQPAVLAVPDAEALPDETPGNEKSTIEGGESPAPGTADASAGQPAKSPPAAEPSQSRYLFIFDAGASGLTGFPVSLTPEFIIRVGSIGHAKLISPNALHVIVRTGGDSADSVTLTFDRVYTRVGAN